MHVLKKKDLFTSLRWQFEKLLYELKKKKICLQVFAATNYYVNLKKKKKICLTANWKNVCNGNYMNFKKKKKLQLLPLIIKCTFFKKKKDMFTAAANWKNVCGDR